MRKTPRLCTVAATIAFAVALAPMSAHGAADYLTLEQKFTESGSHELGSGVACSGNAAIVGGEGTASIYTRYHNTWSQAQSLVPDPVEPTPAADGYGTAVDIDGGLAVVGAPFNSGGAGAVYVFTRSGSTWHYTQKLTAADAAPGDHFGENVTIDGTTIVVGAPADDEAGEDAGAAYVFARDGSWGQIQKLVAPNPAAGDWFGHSVCLDGDNLVVGAPQHQTNGMPAAGMVYAYSRANGTFGTPQELVKFAPDAPHGDDVESWAFFGCGVAVRGNTVLVGATGPSGGAFVFVKPTTGPWAPQAELAIPNRDGTERYGWSVALCTDAAIVGGYLEDSGKGAAAFFTRSNGAWTLDKMLAGSDSAAGDAYAYSVDLYCSVAVVGATGDNAGAGSVYFHSTSEAVPVYRFYNPKAGTHFYTASPEERAYVWANYWRVYADEGVAYMVNPANNTHALYRFYNHTNGSHFYTADEGEMWHVRNTWPNIFRFEGPRYLVSMDSGGGTKPPVWRFWNRRNGSHFYTSNESEMWHVRNTWPDVYRYEDVAFYLGQ